jgi:signal transduction histidine kinase
MGLICFGITITAAILTAIFPNCGLVFVFLLGTSITLYAIIFTKIRYKKINELSEYLYRIYMGEYTLDVRDYKEGELSILKSEIYKLTLRMIEQNELLLKDKTYLADALSDITHQLKTPLTSISMMADLLATDHIDDVKRLEFTKNIHTQVERMRRLVVSLLKMSKLDAKAVELKQEPILLRDLVEQTMEPFRIIEELKEIKVHIEGDDEASCMGDFPWLQEAVSNVLKNCLEHTERQGNIHIHYSQNAIYSQISITDSGEGIDEEDLPHIFERFYKGKNANSDSVGIGLALAKQIITGHNGSIHIISEKEKGSKFIIKLYKVTKLSPNMSS